MCQSLQSNQGQAWIPEFLKNTSGTRVNVPEGAGSPVRPVAASVPLGDGMADAAKNSILSRRERIRRAVEGE